MKVTVKGREEKGGKWREKGKEKEVKKGRKEEKGEWRLEDCSPLRQSHWSMCQTTGLQRTMH